MSLDVRQAFRRGPSASNAHANCRLPANAPSNASAPCSVNDPLLAASDSNSPQTRGSLNEATSRARVGARGNEAAKASASLSFGDRGSGLRYASRAGGKALSTTCAKPRQHTSHPSSDVSGSVNEETAWHSLSSASTPNLASLSASWHTQSPSNASTSPSKGVCSLEPPNRAYSPTMQSNTAGAVVSSHDASLGGGGPGGGSVGRTEAGRGASSVQADSRQGNNTPLKTKRQVSAPNSFNPSLSRTLLKVARAAFRTFSLGSATSRARPSSKGHQSSNCASSGGGSFSGPSGRSPSRDADAARVAARMEPSASARAHASKRANASKAVALRASSLNDVYEGKQ